MMTMLLAALFGAPPAYHDLVEDDTPLLWYRFDESSGSSTVINHGTLGNGFDATAFNGPTFERPTIGGDTGVQFERTSSQWMESLSIVPASLTGNPDFTVETVIFVPEDATGTNWTPFLHWGVGLTAREVYFSIQNDRPDVMYAGFYNGGLRSVCPIMRGAWNHIAWVRDSNAGSNGPLVGSTLYVNGVAVATENDTELPGFATVDVQASPFRIQRASDNTRHADLTMDEVVLYDALLTESDMQARVQALGIAEPEPCLADLTGDCGQLDIFDVLRFLEYFETQDARADLTEPFGVFDIFDVLAYLGLFSEGC